MTDEVPTSRIGPYIEYPDGTVTERATGAVVWRPGDPPEARPTNPPMGESTKPHNVKRGL